MFMSIMRMCAAAPNTESQLDWCSCVTQPVLTEHHLFIFHAVASIVKMAPDINIYSIYSSM